MSCGVSFARHAVIIAALFTPLALGQGGAVEEIAKYRAALQDGNPAELWEARGEGLWKQPRGPKPATLEKCDLGRGAGVVKGAYAELPRYFSDAGRVMDLETRLVWCMVTLQGRSREEATKRVFGNEDQLSEMEFLSAYIATQSRGAT